MIPTMPHPAAAASPPVPGSPPLVMGVLNVTPDSFSDGGLWSDTEAAVAHGLRLAAQGAAIVDVGGESTRPQADRIDEATELARVIPVITALSAAGVTVSVDTMRARVAARAVEAGARIVNDVSGGLADDEMGPLVAKTAVTYVVMHWRGHSKKMADLAVYGDVVADVCAELAARVDTLRGQGVAAEQLVLDPGLGFAKTPTHNWSLLAHLGVLGELGYPLLVGASRKGFLGLLDPDETGSPCPPRERDVATAVTSLLCAQAGIWAVRVHDVSSTRSAIRVAQALRDAT